MELKIWCYISVTMICVSENVNEDMNMDSRGKAISNYFRVTLDNKQVAQRYLNFVTATFEMEFLY